MIPARLVVDQATPCQITFHRVGDLNTVTGTRATLNDARADLTAGAVREARFGHVKLTRHDINYLISVMDDEAMDRDLDRVAEAQDPMSEERTR